MIEAAGAFDAWGSAVVGGITAAVAAVAAVFFAQRLANGSADRARSAQTADALIDAASNARDAAASGARRSSGRFDLWPMRNQLAIARSSLLDPICLERVQALYGRMDDLREWLRLRYPSGAEDYDTQPAQLDGYCEALMLDTEWVIDSLGAHKRRQSLPPKSGRTVYPVLPA